MRSYTKKLSFRANEQLVQYLIQCKIMRKTGKMNPDIDFSNICNIALQDFIETKHAKSLPSMKIECIKALASRHNKEIDHHVHEIKILQEKKHALERLERAQMKLS